MPKAGLCANARLAILVPHVNLSQQQTPALANSAKMEVLAATSTARLNAIARKAMLVQPAPKSTQHQPHAKLIPVKTVALARCYLANQLASVLTVTLVISARYRLCLTTRS